MNCSSSSIPRGNNCRSLLLFLLFLVGICAAALYIGAVPTRKFGHDIFFLLDNGWRVVTGQRPHLDFTSPWGPLSFLVVAGGMAVSHNSADAIGYGNAMLGGLVGIWGYLLCRDAVPSWPRILVSLYLVLLVVTPYPLGWGMLNSSHAMFYNRYGYALLGLLMIEAFLRGQDRRSDTAELACGFSTGAVTALALFLKANYFVAALLLIGASLVWRGAARWRLTGMAVGFFLVSLAFLAYLQFDLAAVVRDLQMAAGARSKHFKYIELFRKLELNAATLVFVLLLTFQNGRVKGETGGKSRLQAGMLFGCFVFAVDMLLLCSNQQHLELPLTAIFSLWVVIDAMVRERKTNGGLRYAAHGAKITILVGTGFFLISFGMQLAGLAYGFMQKAHPTEVGSVTRFTQPRLASLLLYDDPAEPLSNGRPYVEAVNDGLRLLERNFTGSEKVLTMDMMNPFPYALEWPAPRGGMAAIAYNYTFSDQHRPSDARFFGDADLVMVPKRPAAVRWMNDGLLRIYRPGLQARFRLMAESNLWYLYGRR